MFQPSLKTFDPDDDDGDPGPYDDDGQGSQEVEAPGEPGQSPIGIPSSCPARGDESAT